MVVSDSKDATLLKRDLPENLSGKNFSYAVFEDVYFGGDGSAGRSGFRYLSNSNFKGALFHNVSLFYVSAQGSNFEDSKLTGKELNFAIFNGSNLKNMEINVGKCIGVGLKGAIMPDGKVYDDLFYPEPKTGFPTWRELPASKAKALAPSPFK